MPVNIAQEVAALARLTVPELRRRYAELFGEETRVGNKPWLIKRLAWRLQALAEGDISERARRRAAELANDADIRLSPPRPQARAAEASAATALALRRDRRLPPAGAVLKRCYKGRRLRVQVLAEGFEFDGQVYRSLSAVAQAITGAHYNGFLFFGLKRRAKA